MAVRSNAPEVLKWLQTPKAAQKEQGKVSLVLSTFCKCGKTWLVLMEDLSQRDEEASVEFNALSINESSGYSPVTYAFCV